MSPVRQDQWTQRISRLRALKDRFTSQTSFDRAAQAHRAIQHVYERWADEVFAAAH